MRLIPIARIYMSSGFFYILIWVLLFPFSLSHACEDIQLINGDKFTVNEFDVFSQVPRIYQHKLVLDVIGNCQGAELTFKPRYGEANSNLKIIVYSGLTELYNSDSATNPQYALPVSKTPEKLIIPLSFSIQFNENTAPGISRKYLDFTIQANDELGSKIEFNHRMVVEVDVASRLVAGFSGTNVDAYSQYYDLNLGKLETGNKSRRMQFFIQSNLPYEISIRSKNNGSFVLDNDKVDISENTIRYLVFVDDVTLDLSEGSSLMGEHPVSNSAVGNSHDMSIQVTGSTSRKRAGIYSDTLYIEIRQTN